MYDGIDRSDQIRPNPYLLADFTVKSSVTVSSLHDCYYSEWLLNTINCMVTNAIPPRVCFLPDKIKSIPNLTPLLITIDPDRDTVEAMAAYVKGRSNHDAKTHPYVVCPAT